MNVAVVHVRKVRVPVGQYGMAMRVHMRFDAVPLEIMLMSMMGIVDMGVCMVQRLMGVSVLMPLAEVEPDAECHQARRHPEHARPTPPVVTAPACTAR